MKYIYIGILFLFVFSVNLVSKEINFTLPSKALQDFVFVTYNGSKIDTLAVGKIDFAGNGTIKIKEDYDLVSFMGILSFADNNALDLIVTENSFGFSDKEGRLSFTNSPQNDLFYNRKNEVVNPENEGLFVKDYLTLMASVLQINQIARNEQQGGMAVSTKARVDGLKYINPDLLYYTKFWSLGISGFLLIAPSQDTFARDMIKLLDKTTLPNVYTALVEDLITITNQYGMDDAFVLIMRHVMDSKRILYPQGKIFDAFQSMKVIKGAQVDSLSDLEDLDYTPSSTLLVFNAVDCAHCVVEMKKLVDLYSLLKEKKIRVITITSALSESGFLKEVATFPWRDKRMDNANYNKSLSKQYGVIGTPTLFLIDSNNTVQGKYSTIDDLLRGLN